MNLDGKETTSIDVVTEGRKNCAVVSFEGGGDNPPLHKGDVITLKDLKYMKNYDIFKKIDEYKSQKTSTLPILHRQLSKIRLSNCSC